jgi:hypothetical protein
MVRGFSWVKTFAAATAKLERGLGGNRFHVSNAADAVSPENLLGLGHRLIETLEE